MAKRRSSRRYAARPARRSGGGRKRGIAIAPVAGAAITAMGMYKHYKALKLAGYNSEEAAVGATVSYDMKTNTWNRDNFVGKYAPAVAGIAIHEVAGNTRGAFNTGVGLKLNRYFPKGVKL